MQIVCISKQSHGKLAISSIYLFQVWVDDYISAIFDILFIYT